MCDARYPHCQSQLQFLGCLILFLEHCWSLGLSLGFALKTGTELSKGIQTFELYIYYGFLLFHRVYCYRKRKKRSTGGKSVSLCCILENKDNK